MISMMKKEPKNIYDHPTAISIFFLLINVTRKMGEGFFFLNVT